MSTAVEGARAISEFGVLIVIAGLALAFTAHWYLKVRPTHDAERAEERTYQRLQEKIWNEAMARSNVTMERLTVAFENNQKVIEANTSERTETRETHRAICASIDQLRQELVAHDDRAEIIAKDVAVIKDLQR